MKWHRFPKSPTFAAGHKWQLQKRKGYESDVTVLVRAMLQDDSIREDQAAAWERWRNEPGQLHQVPGQEVGEGGEGIGRKA